MAEEEEEAEAEGEEEEEVEVVEDSNDGGIQCGEQSVSSRCGRRWKK